MSGSKDFLSVNFQLPLSGSPAGVPEEGDAPQGDFQLPLSGSQALRICGFQFLQFLHFQLPLSGSHHIKERAVPFEATPKAFNSLSRDHPKYYEFMVKAKEKAFNSLSRDHCVIVFRQVDVEFHVLSTPSLGITTGPIAKRPEWRLWLSTPSLGITRKLTQSLKIRIRVFQLPLSGSPSPIPGFSGSPRLSAAAPFRTNDF